MFMCFAVGQVCHAAALRVTEEGLMNMCSAVGQASHAAALLVVD